MTIDQKTCIVPKALSGYRKPEKEEHEKIYACMRKELSRKGLELSVFSFIYGFLSLGLFASLIMNMPKEGLPLLGEIVGCIVAILLGVVFALIMGHCSRNKKLQQCFLDGDYEVLDCRAGAVYTNLSNVSSGAVRILDADGRTCTDGYKIDIETAKACECGEDPKLLLILQRENDYSRVVTEHMLNGKY